VLAASCETQDSNETDQHCGSTKITPLHRNASLRRSCEGMGSERRK
jgi:hypothetical protein